MFGWARAAANCDCFLSAVVKMLKIILENSPSKFVGLTYCFPFELYFMCIEIHVFVTFGGS